MSPESKQDVNWVIDVVFLCFCGISSRLMIIRQFLAYQLQLNHLRGYKIHLTNDTVAATNVLSIEEVN